MILVSHCSVSKVSRASPGFINTTYKLLTPLYMLAILETPLTCACTPLHAPAHAWIAHSRTKHV